MIRRVLFVLCAILLLGVAVPKAHAGNDRVAFLNDIVVPEGEEAHDAVCFLCSIRVEGDLRGDAVAFLGSVHAKGHIQGDVVTFLGGVDLGDNATIGKNCVIFAGSMHHHNGNQIGKDLVVFPLVLFLLPFLLLIAFIYGIRALFFRPRYVYPPPPMPR
jgi:hypothetical protein